MCRVGSEERKPSAGPADAPTGSPARALSMFLLFEALCAGPSLSVAIAQKLPIVVQYQSVEGCSRGR